MHTTPQKRLFVNDLDLSDAEKESVAYIAGAVLKNVGSKLCELKRKIVSNGQDVATVDKDITILNACKGILVQNNFVQILYYLSHWGMYQFKIISLMQLHMKLLNMNKNLKCLKSL